MILCQCLYAKRNLSLYDDPKQFEIVAELKDYATAKRVALDMLRDRAKAAGIQRFWQCGKKKAHQSHFACRKTKCWKSKVSSKPEFYSPTTKTLSVTTAALWAAV